MITRPPAGCYYRLSEQDAKAIAGLVGSELERAVDDAIIRQKLELEEILEADGFEIVERYVDRDLSAWRRSVVRHDYRRLVGDVRAGRFRNGIIAALHVDRLARRVTEGSELLEALLGGGAGIYAPKEGIKARDTKQAVFYLHLLFAMAQQESDLKSSKIKEQAEARRKAGLGSTGGKVRPFGFSDTTSYPTLVDAEARALREGANSIIAGESVRGTAITWNAARLLRPGGGSWSPSKVRRQFLEPRLSGRRWASARPHKADDRSNQEWSPQLLPVVGKLPAILDVPTHDLVIAILTDPSRAPGGRRTSENLLAGNLLVCGGKIVAPDGTLIACGRRLYSNPSNRTGRRYSCRLDSGGCGRLSSLAAPIDSIATALTIGALTTPGVAAAIEAELTAARPPADLTELRGLELALERLRDDYYGPEPPPRAYYLDRTADLKDRISSQRAALMQPSHVEVQALHDPAEVMRSGNLEQRRALIRLVFLRFELLPTEKRGPGFDAARLRPVMREFGPVVR